MNGLFRLPQISGGCTVYLYGFVLYIADYVFEEIWDTPSEVAIVRAVAFEIFIARAWNAKCILNRWIFSA